MRRRHLLAGGLALAAPALARAQIAPSATLQDLARRATIYLFPVYEMYRTRWQATVDEANPLRQRLNRFRHVGTLADHRSRAVTTPNNDTLYSWAWLDLSIEPMFLTVPPVGDLYYSYAFLDLFTDTIATVSHRRLGGSPSTHMIVGPRWTGDAPSEVTLLRSPTNSVWLIGRLLVDGPEEVERVHVLQTRTLLETPDMRNERRILETRELMRYRTVAPVEPVADWPAPHPEDPFDLFDAALRALSESPLGERDRATFETFSALKLRPGRRFDQRAFSGVERETIAAGIAQGRAEIRAAAARGGRTIDGWSYSERHLGRFGDDHLYRARVALSGLGALEPAEAVYVTGHADSAGQPLSGAWAYRLAFPAGALPPARAFWSLAAYEVMADGRAFLVDNPIGRHSIGDRTRGLVRGEDGSLTLYIQHEPPDGARAANWLPAPAGAMRLVLRAYEPRQTMIDGSYRLPALQRVAPA
ncbi:DUF1254 domain-containing protein [Reyranella sp.]|uniref:DUF1254 domain-containing protein n=1 Tax=Reyranella sp. TaxID=1929291 RepID=UPI003BAC4295